MSVQGQCLPKVDPKDSETWPARLTYANETGSKHMNGTTEVKGVSDVDSVEDFETIEMIMQATSFTIVLPLDDLSCGLDMTSAEVREEVERLNKKYPGLKLSFEENDDKNLGFVQRMMNGTMTEEHARADIVAEGNLDPYNIQDLEDEELNDYSEEDIAEYTEGISDSSGDEMSASIMPVRTRVKVEKC